MRDSCNDKYFVLGTFVLGAHRTQIINKVSNINHMIIVYLSEICFLIIIRDKILIINYN